MISYKLYLYDSSQESNGYKGQEFSKHIMQGVEIKLNLDDTLDTIDLTLHGLTFREEFAPSTKFILELWDNSSGSELFYTDYHIQVANDTVSQPIISDDNYFSHHISFIEAIIEAQTRVVDNIAVTYKLKNVNLQVPASYDSQLPISTYTQNIDHVSNDNYGEFSGFVNWRNRRVGHQFKWVMPDWYTVNIGGNNILPIDFDWNDIKYYQLADTITGQATIEFPVPMLEVSASIQNSKSFRKNGYASIEAVITKTNRNTGITEVENIITINPDISDVAESWVTDPMLSLNDGWIEGSPYAYKASFPGAIGTVGILTSRVSKVAEFSNGKTNRKIQITADVGYSYSIQFRRKEFNPQTIAGSGYSNLQGLPYSVIYEPQPAYYGFAEYVTIFASWINIKNEKIYTNPDNPSLSFSFICTFEEQGIDIYLKSAPSQNALGLFQKAVLVTQDNTKQQGIPVSETKTTFYVGQSDYERLKNVKIVENFYNQKNLFEIFMDVGKYIHARPYARFGSDNRYLVEWKEYGKTEQFEDINTKASIFNSRFVEEYISSISSYVSNMVQLGGEIIETVSPKSSSEDFLVYNDVAEIIVNKPIIEILEVIAINKDNVERDITEYTYEKGIYKLLPVTRTPFEEKVYDKRINFPEIGEPNIVYIAQDEPNIFYTWNSTASEYSSTSWSDFSEVSKGLAIYYELGSNIIKGLNYRMPTINTGDNDNDYAIKRILSKVYEISEKHLISSIKVNDYSFRIRYRTKDTLRVNQSRPDIRKYILASKFDKFPQHVQFNNQEDTLVDSVKFGNNTYGKLIRTGNTVYTYNEIVTSLGELKQVGELYNIEGQLYYVSKVHNTIFSEHAFSQVEFSKDFNRLSQIIGIPSEPRFYEISEQSLITREKTFDDFIVLGTSPKSNTLDNSFLRNNGIEYISSLLLNNEKYPQYAVTYFKNDIDTKDPTYPNRETFSTSVCHPISTYSMQNTLTMEWDMLDNFSAGDKVSETNKSVVASDTVLGNLKALFNSSVGEILGTNQSENDTAYNTLLPVKYCDANGRADLVDFAIIKEFTPNRIQTQRLPENPFDTIPENEYLFGNQNIENFGKNDSGEILLKDNREVITLNYNLQLITDSDRFVVSAYMWQKEKTNLKIGVLKNEVNKISNETIPSNDFLIEELPLNYEVVDNAIVIKIQDALSNVDIGDAQSIVIYSTNEVNDYVSSGSKYFVFARNIGGLDETEAKKNWIISNYNKEMFTKQ